MSADSIGICFPFRMQISGADKRPAGRAWIGCLAFSALAAVLAEET